MAWSTASHKYPTRPIRPSQTANRTERHGWGFTFRLYRLTDNKDHEPAADKINPARQTYPHAAGGMALLNASKSTGL